MPVRHSSILRHGVPLLLLVMTAACSKSPDSATTLEAAAPAAPAAPAATASGAAEPDTSNARCQLIPPDQVAEYRRLHDVFSGPADLEPQFTKGKLFADGEEISFKYPKGPQGLGLTVGLLQNCSETEIANLNLYAASEGSGMISTPMHTSNSGSTYPAGTPGVVRVTMTEVNTQTMTGKTTVLAEYSIRLKGPE